MTTKHTTGPWDLDGLLVNSEYGGICLMGLPAQHAGDSASMLPNWEANARLITAAPDLLVERDAALQHVAHLTAVVGALEARIAELEAQASASPRMSESDFDCLILDALAEAMKAMKKFPQPNYVISKIAEEAGEVVKAAIHCAEGRETAENVRGEMKQLIAMLYRLWVEGDLVHGLPPVAAAIRARSEVLK